MKQKSFSGNKKTLRFIGTRKHTDIGEHDFQILLTDNYYVNPNSIHICFPMKIKKPSNVANDIDTNMITNIISVTKYGSNKELTPTFSPYEIYQYSDAMLKHLPKDALKKLKKHCFKVKQVFTTTVHQ